MMHSSLSNPAGLAAKPASRLLAVLLSAALGAVLLWGVGFAHANALHNAAHDTRHSNGFPCH
jgi:cobalt transporter subunit CbtB